MLWLSLLQLPAALFLDTLRFWLKTRKVNLSQTSKSPLPALAAASFASSQLDSLKTFCCLPISTDQPMLLPVFLLVPPLLPKSLLPLWLLTLVPAVLHVILVALLMELLVHLLALLLMALVVLLLVFPLVLLLVLPLVLLLVLLLASCHRLCLLLLWPVPFLVTTPAIRHVEALVVSWLVVLVAVLVAICALTCPLPRLVILFTTIPPAICLLLIALVVCHDADVCTETMLKIFKHSPLINRLKNNNNKKNSKNNNTNKNNKNSKNSKNKNK